MTRKHLARSPTQTAESCSYDPDSFAQLFAVEDRHFWFRARNKAIASQASQVTARMTAGYRVLEAGCGTGNVLRVLELTCTGGMVVGMDLFPEGLQYARQRTSCSLVRGDINALPFARPFDVVCLFDVLEHLHDDVEVLGSLHKMLSRNGVLLLTVPAHPSLWSYFDVASHHCRRYEVEELKSKLAGAGFRVEYITYYMASIFPLVWLGRRLRSLKRRGAAPDVDGAKALASGELRVIPVVNGLLAFLLSLEAPLIARRRHLPIGTSLLVVARGDSASGE
jgi:SAM-dependent methyltransferase